MSGNPDFAGSGHVAILAGPSAFGKFGVDQVANPGYNLGVPTNPNTHLMLALSQLSAACTYSRELGGIFLALDGEDLEGDVPPHVNVVRFPAEEVAKYHHRHPRVPGDLRGRYRCLQFSAGVQHQLAAGYKSEWYREPLVGREAVRVKHADQCNIAASALIYVVD